MYPAAHRIAAFLARQVPTGGIRRTVAKTDSSGWRPVAIFDYSSFLYVGELLRATNHEPLFFHELRFTRGDVVILNLLPQSGILSPRRPANCGAVRPIHRIVDNVAISLYNINTYSYSMRLAEKGDFIDEF